MKLSRWLTLILFTAPLLLTAAGTPTQAPDPAAPGVQNELAAALTLRLQAPAAARAVSLDLFTPEVSHAFTTPDGKTAVLWLALRDGMGHILATEPGLALARLSDSGWQVLLPGDPGWDSTLASLPEQMAPVELSPALKTTFTNAPAAPSALTGYYLPYAAGTSHRLEGSISHFQNLPELGYPSCAITYCHYAYDFTDVGHYPLLASKDGTVLGTQGSCPDGGTSCTNYVVLYNASDNAYQIYLHLSHGTIPAKLTYGVQVKRGQYLGDTDDTGYSTSNHVHFMVVSANTLYFAYAGYYWGQSIDVRFADVAINNGIPRTCYEVTHFQIYDGATACLGSRSDPTNPANDWFVSGNVGAYPPTGTLTRPAAGITVNSGSNPLIDVTATVSDDVGVTAVRLVAKLNGQWVEIGPKVTQPAGPGLYDWDVNLCAVGPLNGPLDVALRAWDYEGNVSAALAPRTIQVDHACPPPVSQLAPAETFDSTAVHLSWTGSSSGAGLASYELEWRSDPGAWDAANTLTFPASQQATWFGGQPGGAYSFRLRALDLNGQPEPWPAGDAAETSVALPSTCAPDVFEPDDNMTQARSMALGELASGNLCGAGNPDWFKLTLDEAKAYTVRAWSQCGGAAVKITVYDSDGVTILASGAAGGIAQDAAVDFRTTATGTYYFKIEPLLPSLFGTGAVYRVGAWESMYSYFPKVMR